MSHALRTDVNGMRCSFAYDAAVAATDVGTAFSEGRQQSVTTNDYRGVVRF
eukprot:CAMPEP_0174855510 /NCGR_PEP_ID=MMETSP1114-20130205/33447_1 /TAXON_ID=312471 /ORGANISM="Neobodo designis, Strain CCAP 1951/1" /LENGTH=50 /DNA_ID=CAMNT_0016090251 /DNA_START=30 /DNA_END=179 /DNA_ORIENTATION=+